MRRVLLLIGVCCALLLLEFVIISRLSDSVRQFMSLFPETRRGSQAISQQDDFDSHPLFVLHIGPPKTGTTSIQNFSTKQRSLLEQDNVYYIGNARFEGGFCTHDLARTCRLGSLAECKSAWKAFGKVLDLHYGLNHTVFVSEENFSIFLDGGLERDRLFKYLTPLLRRWRVRLIFSYRRHYEFLSALYVQHHDPAKRLEWKSWPSMGGNETPSFPDFVDRWEQSLSLFEPVEMKNRWQENFRNEQIQIFNFHSQGDLLQNFFCYEIPHAPTACRYLRNNKDEVAANPSLYKALHFDMIAVAAYTRGLIANATLCREDVAQATREYASQLGLEKLTDFPLEELSPRQAHDLLLHSHQVEQTLLPDFYSAVDVDSGFQHYMNAKRFASVNATAVLEDPQWRHFFSTL